MHELPAVERLDPDVRQARAAPRGAARGRSTPARSRGRASSGPDRAAADSRRKRPFPVPISISTGATRPKSAARSTGAGVRRLAREEDPRRRDPRPVRRRRPCARTAARRRRASGLAGRTAGPSGDDLRDRHDPDADVPFDPRLAAEPDAGPHLVRDLVRLDGREVLGVDDALDAAGRAGPAAAADVEIATPRSSAASRTVRPAGNDARAFPGRERRPSASGSAPLPPGLLPEAGPRVIRIRSMARGEARSTRNSRSPSRQRAPGLGNPPEPLEQEAGHRARRRSPRTRAPRSCSSEESG